MERHLDESLDKFKTDILKMAALTESAIHNSIEALKNQDRAMAEKTISEDKGIDEYENLLEEEAIEILACFQPMARDLRFIMTGLSISDDLERIADLVVNICQRTIELSAAPLLKPLIDMPLLAENAKEMVKNAIDAFVRRDETLAKEVIMADVESDRLRTSIVRELIFDYMVKDGTTSPRAVPLLLMARDFERISDHAVSMAEEVIYMVQAKVVRHHPERLENDGQEQA
jgi:phosphate transport system protein